MNSPFEQHMMMKIVVTHFAKPLGACDIYPPFSPPMFLGPGKRGSCDFVIGQQPGAMDYT